MAKHKHHGSTLDAFLEEEGLTEVVDAIIQKRAIAEQLRGAMQAQNISESAMARRMATSRTVVRNLLDPKNEGATLVTIAKAANAVGRRLSVTLEPRSIVIRARGPSRVQSGRAGSVVGGDKKRAKRPAR